MKNTENSKMGVVFSEEQKKVIETRDRNILVAAAAGSGKTTVLVERIIQKICDKEKPVDIDRLLIVTFTNAAASSMRQKISDALEKQLVLEPNDKHLQRQAMLVHNAQITTIDSFCLYILQNNFNDIGLEPGFRVADEGEMRLLKEEIMEKLLEDRLSEEENDNFLRLADRFCKTANLTPLTEILYDVYDHALSYPFPLEWLALRMQDYSEDMNYVGQVVQYISRMVEELIVEMEKAIDISFTSDGPYMYEDNLKQDIAFLQSLKECGDYEKMQQIMQSFTFSRLSSKKDDSVSSEKRELVKSIRESVKKMIGKISGDFFAFKIDTMKLSDVNNQEILQELLKTVAMFYTRFQEEKQEKKIIDFSDMEHYALSILLRKGENGYEPTDTAKEYRAHFEEIMIDEYQDSNLVQEWLLKAVSKEEDGVYNRFMVGDVKQSIYKFRLACPQLFMEKYDTYETDGQKLMRIDLSKNFRSRIEVLNSTNMIFRKIMGKDLGNVEYDDKNALYLGAQYQSKPSLMDTTELILVHKDPEGRGSKEDEAKAVALRIRELVREYQVEDEETHQLRPATYKDIVILLRKTKQWDEIMKRTFEQYGIPARIATSEGYFSTVEIQNVLNLLYVLDNPKQDIPFYGVLCSEFGAFTQNEVAQLAAVQKQEKKRYLCDVVFRSSLLPEELDEKCRCFTDFFERYRKLVKHESIHKLLRQIFDETSYLIKMSALPGGEQRKRNILMLLEKAENYEKSSMKGLFSFIRYIERLQKYKVEFGEAVLNEEGVNAVQIMSIHKSKGLEFPICIVAGLGAKFNKLDIQKPLICDTEYGIGFDYVNQQKRAKYPNLRNNLLKQKILEDNLGEELRILYVAFTRAKEKLILMGLVKENLNVLPCSGRLSLIDRLKANCYLDYILPAALGEEAVIIREMGEEDFRKQDILEAVVHQESKECLIAELEGIQNRTDSEDKESIYEQRKQLEERISKDYKHSNLQNLYTKTSVSELKIADMQKAYQKENKEEPAFAMFGHSEKMGIVPKFLSEEKEASGSDRGSAYHRALELIDYKNSSSSLVQNSLKELVQRGQMTEKEFSLLNIEKLKLFLDSDIAKRMSAADEKGLLFKEQPFVLGIAANRLNEEFPSDEKVLIQGIIDVYFEEDGEIVLLDYKTDAVKSGSELILRYETQIKYYTEAIERITGKTVKEKLLYSFALNEIVCI